jgi:hypothetical protein
MRAPLALVELTGRDDLRARCTAVSSEAVP